MRVSTLSRIPVVILAVVACGKAEKPAEQAAPPAAPPAPPTVHVTATEYAFDAPDTLTAGQTTFHLMNHGKELHHLVLLRLAPGQTVADLQRMNPDAGPPPNVTMIGGPNPAVPDGSAEATVDLKAGQYAMICVIPSSVDGKVHLLKGMIRGLTVVEGASTAAAPTPDITIKMTDYAFDPSTPLTAGHHVLRVENAGPQVHELVMVKLDAGKTMADFAKWAEKLQGPPPGQPLGGASPMSTGESNTVTVDLSPGEYGFICFVGDSKDGKPHLAHGMVKQFTVM